MLGKQLWPVAASLGRADRTLPAAQSHCTALSWKATVTSTPVLTQEQLTTELHEDSLRVLLGLRTSASCKGTNATFLRWPDSLPEPLPSSDNEAPESDPGPGPAF